MKTIEDMAEDLLSEEYSAEIPKLKKLSELDDTPIEWLIKDWIPKKGITLLCSDGGVGKTYLSVSILSAISSGRSSIFEDEITREPKPVLFFSGEDVESVLRERLIRAEATDNVYCAGQDSDVDVVFSSPLLENMIKVYRPALICFDPLQSFVSKDVDMSRRNQMRQCLKPLQKIASKYNCGVLILMHTNKRDASGRQKMADSSDLWDMARSVLMAGFTNEKQRYVSLEKSSNTDHLQVPSVLFEIKDGKVEAVDAVMKKMCDFEGTKKPKKESPAAHVPTLKEKCRDEIMKFLSDHSYCEQGVFASHILSGFTESTFRTARESLLGEEKIKWTRASDGTVRYSLC